MKKTALYLMLITIISKTLGFAREITLSYAYGASNISDAYIISNTIPTFIFSFIGIGIATSYIPMYNTIEKEEGIQSANNFTNNLVNFVIFISTLIIITTFVLATPIVKLFASGFDEETVNLAVDFTRISIFGIYFIGLGYIFRSYLQIRGNFIIPNLTGIPFNFFIIISIMLSVKYNVKVLPIGIILANISQVLFLIPFLYKKKYRYHFEFNKSNKYLKQTLYLSLPAVFGVSINEINSLVDRTIASRIVIGGISALNYANRLNGFVQGIFIMSIATVMYPMISKMAAENNMIGLKKSVSEAISSINLLVLPATVGAMIFAEPIVRLLFGRGAFDTNAIIMTSYALLFYSIGMIGFGLREILSRAFYSLQDTKTPMINAAIAMVMNIILNIILSKFLGIGGLALATSISAIFCTVLLFISLRKKIGPFGMKRITISFIKILCASLVMGVITKVSYTTLSNYINANLSLILSIGIGAVTYFILIYFMKIEEVDVIVNAMKRKMIKVAP
ncbi:MAG: murein biosynthesis integral rane protein MurJ [Clostridia bacterium]|jgi:putative peptidoglycan lipid II flippase|nr:murein biosynthesis integral rane protein MurJ [Clostridia bacterium]